MIKHAMAPVWEANHVWLIFVLVMLWTAFPEAFGSITSTLAIPLFLAALGIILRGGAFALQGEAATIAEARALGATFAVVRADAVLPRRIGGRIASGRVPVGNAAGDQWGAGPTAADLARRARRRDGRLPRRRLPRRRFARAGRRSWSRLPPPALGSGRVAGRCDRRAAVVKSERLAFTTGSRPAPGSPA